MHWQLQQIGDGAFSSRRRPPTQDILYRTLRQTLGLFERQSRPVFPSDCCLDVFFVQCRSSMNPVSGLCGPIWGR